MKNVVILFVSLALAAASTIPDNVSISKETGVYGYHKKVGIPLYEKIKAYEDALLANPEKVVGGWSTLAAAVPYQAGLILTISFVFTSVCSGTLISDHTILGAAHCQNDGSTVAQSTLVVLGSSLLNTGGTRIQSTAVFMHPGYNPNIAANDIACFRIPPVSFSLTISPANLPIGSQLNSDFNGFTGLSSGFGVTAEGQSIGIFQSLSSVNLRIISNTECRNVYGNIVQDHHLCTSGAGGVGICDGDTGGPLTVNDNGRRILVGIAAWRASAGCSSGFPSAFSRITSFIHWIWSIQ